MSASERDPRLDRLFALTDGVYAIALTLLAVELILPAASEHLHGKDLLQSILDFWPKILGFLTSFTLIGLFWHGNHRAFHYLRRFDSPLDWLMLLHLLCIAFIPFPTSVIGTHIADPVAQQFYFATLFVTGLVMAALWWYLTSRRRLLDPSIGTEFVRRTHVISLSVPAVMLVLMGLVAVGIGRLINPLLLFAFVTLCFIALGVLEWREEGVEPGDDEPQVPAMAGTDAEGSAGRKPEE